MCSCDSSCRYASYNYEFLGDRLISRFHCALDDDTALFEDAKQEALANATDGGRLEEVKAQIEAWEKGCNCRKLCPFFREAKWD